jgi:Brp/Blh family beta-carotene 15,15'-monooxygenase
MEWTAKHPRYFLFAFLLSLGILLLGVLPLSEQNPVFWIIATLLIILIGLPHGATDLFLFRQVETREKPVSTGWFYLGYLGLMGSFGFLFWIAPPLALLLFIGLSSYHFGQSNWYYLGKMKAGGKSIIYLIWGSFPILVPIFFHYESQALPIIQSIWPQVATLPFLLGSNWGWVLIAANLLLVFILWQSKFLTFTQWARESGQILLLAALFWFTPLLLGFATYFALWHSAGSILDQIQFFRTNNQGFTWKKYMGKAAPFWAMAVIGLIGFAALLGQQSNLSNWTAWGFVFIGMVTLPHMLLIEQLYSRIKKSPDYQVSFYRNVTIQEKKLKK